MHLRIITFLLLIIGLGACSTKKNTAINRAYHNTTSRYNGYFNARELMKERVQTLRDQHKDDYSQRLPIFIYPDEKQSQSMYDDMDVVIEKCSEVIERHSMYIRRQERVKWIDDSYFLIGKARFYKQEYGLAEETFLYVYQAYKKIPERYQGLNWLIKTYIEDKEWDKAEEFLDLGESEYNKIPEEFKGMFNAVYADYYLKRDKDVPKAIERLENALKFTDDKFHSRRYTYVLAQLYHEQREYAPAMRYYRSILKMNPDYTMRFNAKISLAMAFDVSGGSSEEIKKELKKMLKDEKNEEFRDQIYYALAELALKENDEPLAIDYLKKSTKVSVSNNKQKALSFLKLADIYFEQPSYVLAQEHYDSTLQFLPEDHPEYYTADEKNNSLQDLVANLKTIEKQDSLLKLSELPEKEREKLVKKMIEEMKAEEERKKQERLMALERQQAEAEAQANSGLLGGLVKGKWYFYNTANMASGRVEFKQVWGRRQLEDNWRRKNKSSGFSSGSGDDGSKPKDQIAQAAKDSSAQAEKYNPETYLKEIPSNYQEQLQAHAKLAEALFNAGTIFKESFDDPKSAIEAFKRITETYDTSKHNLPAHYQLYRIYSAQEMDEEAEEEKNWVLDNHPFSEYAYLIKNPDYAKQSKATKEKIEEYYEATYRLYDYGLYNDVIESCNKADSVFKDNHIQSKFDFLRAKSIGYTRSKEELKVELEKIVENYPEDPIKDKAQKILNFMNNVGGIEEASAFKVNHQDKHMFIMSMPQNHKNSNELKIKLSDFNQNSFRESNLELTTTALPGKQLFMIRTFKDQVEAVRYYKAVSNNNQLTIMASQMNAESYIISLENFRLLFKDKDEKAYLEFFMRQYPQ